MRIIIISFAFLVCIIPVSDCKKGESKCDCGLPLPVTKNSNTRIFNGKDAMQKQFPWQVLIEIGIRFVEKTRIRGGAVLVSMKHVFTCAHLFHETKSPYKRYFKKYLCK